MFKNSPKPFKFAKLHRKEHEVEVVPNLAYDLSQLDALRQQGRPISATSAESIYYEGTETNSFEVPMENQRGVDINDLWNRSKSVHRNLSKLGVSKVDTAQKT